MSGWFCVGVCCRAAAHRGKYYGAPGSSPALLDKLGNQVRMYGVGWDWGVLGEEGFACPRTKGDGDGARGLPDSGLGYAQALKDDHGQLGVCLLHQRCINLPAAHAATVNASSLVSLAAGWLPSCYHTRFGTSLLGPHESPTPAVRPTRPPRSPHTTCGHRHMLSFPVRPPWW